MHAKAYGSVLFSATETAPKLYMVMGFCQKIYSTAVWGNNLLKEINERWDCQQEMIPNHFCVILDQPCLSESKLLGFYGKISKNHNKSKVLLFNKRNAHCLYVILLIFLITAESQGCQNWP